VPDLKHAGGPRLHLEFLLRSFKGGSYGHVFHVRHTGYILLGAYDLVLVVDLPGNDKAVQFSLAMNKMTGISFETCPAITLAEFDRLAAAT
jgi:uncharacterized protein with GYD domain